MKSIFYNKFRKLTILILFAVLAFCTVSFCCIPASAEENQTQPQPSPIYTDKFLPQTELEYTNLTNVTTAFSDNDTKITAIVEDSYIFNIYKNGKITVNNSETKLNHIKYVKLFDDKTIYFSANARLYSYDLTTNTYDILTLNGGTNEPVTYFDFNQNYLVTTYQDQCKIFSLRNKTLITKKGISISNGSSVALNSNNELFTVDSSGGIFKSTINDKSVQQDFSPLTNDTPSKLIANNDYIYYILNGKIHRITTDGRNHVEFSTHQQDKSFDLGNITYPTDISFKGDNLLVLQYDSIQEFEVNDITLVFTGYAIAKGKTAYNRVNGLASLAQIEKYGDNVAILDNAKLTIVNTNTTNPYARENYKNYHLGNGKDLGTDLSTVTLGENTAMLCYNAGTSLYKLKLLDLTKSSEYLTDVTIDTECAVRDICYQGGYYYILTFNSNAQSIVYKINNSVTLITSEHMLANVNNANANRLTVDILGNVYIANTSKIFKLTKENNYAKSNDKDGSYSVDNVTNLQTDLNGSLFLLIDNEVYYLPSFTQNLEKINLVEKTSSFAMDFIDNNIYFIHQDQEYISKTDKLPNLSIADLVVPSEFSLTNTSSNKAPEQLKSYKVSEDQLAFVVRPAGSSFIFERFATNGDEYLYLCPVYDSQNKIILHALAGQGSIILAQSNYTCADVPTNTSIPKKVFITSSVNGYYLPMITNHSTYLLNNNGNAVKLTKNSQIEPQFSIDFLGQSYYYAKFNVDNKEYFGYVPKSFTVEVLEQDFDYNRYTLEKISTTYLYSDSTLTDPLFDTMLEKDTEVRLIDRGNVVSKIAVNVDGQWIEGYIASTRIINRPNIAFRNILVILAVVTSLCGTSAYFLLRKKKD